MKKVVSFCLYGCKATYIIGMKENIKLAKQYYLDWEVRIYYNNTVPEKYINEYREIGAICMLCENIGENKLNWEGMFWRWLPLDDKTVDIWISRDADSRLSEREAKIVDEWINSGKTLHSIRDHRCHFNYIMGGLFGINNKLFHEKYKFKTVSQIIKELSVYYKERPYNVDQIFLNDNLWKILKDDVMAHISKDGRRVYQTDILIPYAPDFIGKQYKLSNHLTSEQPNLITIMIKLGEIFKIKAKNDELYFDIINDTIKLNIFTKNNSQLWKIDENNRIINLLNNKYLDYNNNNHLILTNSKNNTWKFIHDKFIVNNQNNKAIDIKGGKMRVNQQIHLWQQNWSFAQQFTFVKEEQINNKKIGCFVSIPKCASKSILKEFKMGVCRDLDSLDSDNLIIFENHQRLKILEERYNLDDLFVFAFVRNPYDRVKSWFSYHTGPYYDNLTLEEWVNNGCITHFTVQNKTNWKKEGLSPLLQYNFIDTAKKKVDFVGKMENYENDMKIITEKLNSICKERGIKHEFTFHNVKCNTNTNNKNKKNLEMSNEIKEKIYNLFKKDFEYFGYDKDIQYNKNYFLSKSDLDIHNVKNKFILSDSNPYISEDYFMSKANLMLYDYKNYIKYSELNEILESNHLYGCKIIGIHFKLVNYYLDYFINYNKEFVLITTGDTGCFPYETNPCHNIELKIKYDKLLLNKHLIKWYTKNPSIIHEKIMGIPLGTRWRKGADGYLFSEDKLKTFNTLNKYCLDPKEKFHNKSLKTKLVYFGGMGIDTTSNGKRMGWKQHIGCRRLIKTQLESRIKFTGKINFNEYLIELSKSKFIICPPGAGLDTYRCWESLMVGSIPIMYHTPIDPLFEKLPVLLIDDYSIITDEYLNEQYEIIIKKEYDFSILYTDYWDKEFDKYK
jgi:hypothetical protein|tara:strand:+ start:1166 stop:3865 length:2700 start_codon:yes stop_codon:yes gene_type:complete